MGLGLVASGLLFGVLNGIGGEFTLFGSICRFRFLGFRRGAISVDFRLSRLLPSGLLVGVRERVRCRLF